MSKKILIVDDEPACRDFLSFVLEDAGYEVHTATNAREALAAAERVQPDLISLDLMMPGQTGADFYRRIRRNHDLVDIPLIVISGMTGRHLSVTKHIPVYDKPIDPDDLLEAVRQALADDARPEPDQSSAVAL